MTRSGPTFALLAALVAACGGQSSPEPTAPQPAEQEPAGASESGSGESASGAAPSSEPEEVAPPASEAPTPADPEKIKSELLAAEQTAYESAKPVFDKHCAACHQKGGKKAKRKMLQHFDMTAYPFGGHHAAEVSAEVREVLAIGGGKPTMPFNDPGAVQGDELALIAAWADAFDKAHAAGAHQHGGGKH